MGPRTFGSVPPTPASSRKRPSTTPRALAHPLGSSRAPSPADRLAAKALRDLGRIIKTLFLLTYIDDVDYQQRIHAQLNRHESRHSLARALFHGERGQLRQKYREGQEDQLSALGLVVNIVALWNTIYCQAALDRLRSAGSEVATADIARLSPLGHKHINFRGRYNVSHTSTPAPGEFVRYTGLNPTLRSVDTHGPISFVFCNSQKWTVI